MSITRMGESLIEGAGEAVKETLKMTTDGWGLLMKAIDREMGTLANAVKPFSEVQSETAKLVKALGLASSNIMEMSKRLVIQNRAMSLSMNYGISNQEMLKLQTNVLSNIGRNIAIDVTERQIKNERGEIVNKDFDSTLEKLVAARTVFGDETVAALTTGFDKVGKSMKSAAKVTGKLYKEAGEYGINLGKYSKNFTDNLSMVQTFNFSNGVKGLREMARKATEIRQDMGQIARFAEQVGSVTGAVEAAANLQVLGGSFSQLANPLAMLNESLTNMEGLQDRLNDMAKGKARYNNVTHEIEMDPVTRQIMKQAAKSMGIDPNNFIDQAFAETRRGVIKEQMENMGISNAKLEKLLPNVGEIDTETGMAGATIEGEFRTIGQIAASNELQQKLIEETRTESEDIKAIAKSVLTMEDLIKGRQYQLQNEAAGNVIKPGVYQGVSTWQAVSSAILNGVTDKTISAAGKLEFPWMNLKNVLGASLRETAGELISAFDINGSNPTEIAKQIKEGLGTTLGDIFGDGTWFNVASGATSKLVDALNGLITPINEFTKKGGLDMIGPAMADLKVATENLSNFGDATKRNVTGTDQRGGENVATTTGVEEARKDILEKTTQNIPASPQKGAISEAARTQAGIIGTTEIYRRNRETGVGQLTQVEHKLNEEALAKLSSGNTVGLSYKTNEQGPNPTLQPTEPKQGVTFRENPQTLPNTPVTPAQPVQTKQPAQPQDTLSGKDINVKLSGSVTMNVYGGGNKLGSEDIMDILRRNPTYLDEIAKMIADTIVKQNNNVTMPPQ